MRASYFAAIIVALTSAAMPVRAGDAQDLAAFRALIAQRHDKTVEVIREIFPEQYAAEELRIAREYGRTHEADTALLELGKFGNQLKVSYFYQIAQAPDIDLVAIEGARLSFFKMLQSLDPILCYEVGESRPVEADREAKLLHARRDPGADPGLKQLLALKDARVNPVSRGPVTQQDIALIVGMYASRGAQWTILRRGKLTPTRRI
jgi:hypothetical protein